MSLPDGLLVSFYGDDFTGSTAVAEVLSFAGLPTALFLDIPTPERLAEFAGYRAIGIAGVARSKSPAWMDAHLPPLFEALAGLKAPITHYKVCSTLDSAPHVGSIGRAAELAVPRLGGAWHPVLVAAPAIARYQAFGNLFAVVDGEGYRLDRHPTMSRHPVTPMTEADVRRHLAGQTAMPMALVDLLALAASRAAPEPGRLNVIDVIDDASLREAGRLIWANRGDRLFAVGSQGVEYALVAHWQAEGWLDAPPVMRAAAVDRLAVVSGSCSPVTTRQIDHAVAKGFRPLPLNAALAVDARSWQAEIERAAEAAGDGHVVAYTARGPDDPAIPALREAIRASDADGEAVHQRIGEGLGHLLQTILSRTGLRRAVIAGGDSSGHAGTVLGIEALTALAPIAPGAMLCRGHRSTSDIEIAMKGGQMGGPDYFSAVMNGGALS